MAAEEGAEPVVAAPVAQDPNQSGEEKGKWPPPEEQLEKWMMNTVKEGDAGAVFLRTMLQMNPAYGTYLQTDADLVNVVLMFSKRIKTKIAQYETPNHIPPHVLIQPLCEMVWRVVGFVMHGVIELEEEANMPVPKEASGMIKMLLHTNSQLSKKLNDLRRVYLKELSEHRDKQRRLSKTAERAVNNLQEHPIMFYEPLEFVLDETTKDFVREAVVERIKLEMRTAAMNSDENEEMARYMEELERKVDLLEAERDSAKASSNRLEEQLKTLGAKEAKLREDMTQMRQDCEDMTTRMTENDDKMKQMQSELDNKKRKIEFLERQLGEAQGAGNKEVEVQLVDHTEEMESLSQEMIGLKKDNDMKTNLIDQLKQQLKDAMDRLADFEANATPSSDPDAQKALQRALAVEKELRAANEALEKAMAEAEKEAEDLRKENKKLKAKLTSALEGQGGGGPSPDELEEIKAAAIEKALKKATKEYEDKIASLQKENQKLQNKLEKSEERCHELEQELGQASNKGPKQKVVKQVGVPEDEHKALKAKCYELEIQMETMEDEYAKLEQKCAMLMEKLREKFNDSEMGEILTRIKLSAPPVRKKRKKKAYERLYDDAQRRILETKMRAAKLKEIEEKSIANMAKIAQTAKDKSKVKVLTHLHKANQQTSQRLHDAMVNFELSHIGHETGADGEESGEEGIAPGMSMHRSLSDLEEMTIQCFKDGVCPRCAFSALASFRSSTPTTTNQPGLTGVTYSGRLSDPPIQKVGPTYSGRLSDATGMPAALELTGQQSGENSVSGTPQGRSRSPGNAERRFGSPLSAGPAPGAMPFDSAFPMPAPPWRTAAADSAAPTGASASFASSGPPSFKGGGVTNDHAGRVQGGSPTRSSVGPTTSAAVGGGFGASTVPARRGPSPTAARASGGSAASAGMAGGGSAAGASLLVGNFGPTAAMAGGGSAPSAAMAGGGSAPSAAIAGGGFAASAGSIGGGSSPGSIGAVVSLSGFLGGGVAANAAMAGGGFTTSALGGGFSATALPGRESMNSIPPWRRARSNSPMGKGRSPSPAMPQARGLAPRAAGSMPGRDQMPWRTEQGGSIAPGAQPPSGVAPPSKSSMVTSPSYGRLGRLPGPEWAPAPVPGRVPAAQSVMLDPIDPRNVSGVEKDPSPRPLVTKGASSSRSPSPGQKTDGFRAVRAVNQLEADLSRPNSMPSFGQPPRSLYQVGQTVGHRGHLGGGGMGTLYTNISSTQLPTVPSSRSVPMPPTEAAPPPWRSAEEVPWESSVPARKLLQKAPKKPGPGFVVTPLVSQERLSMGSNSTEQ